MKDDKKKKKQTKLTGEELYLAQQKKWANAMTLRRNRGEGKTREQ